MSDITSDELTPILVEWTTTAGGRQQVSATSKKPVGNGTQALGRAMQTIEAVADQVRTMLHTLTTGEQEQRDLARVEIEFGLNLDTEVGAFIAKAGMQATLMVRMTWERNNEA